MTVTDPNYFSTLVNQLGNRAARTAISKFSPVSRAIREYLHNQLERFPGEQGSFLADPVFEASFGWERAANSMRELSGNLLHPDLVESLNSSHEGLEEQRFDASWSPYVHQVNAWKLLQEEPPRSIIVSSGTGSGKTECFLIPILDSLSRQLEQQKNLIGVQALLLYPLNALINSQRERLSAWTKSYGGKIRYALYNGDTEHTVPKHRQNAHPEEVLSREYLRDAPPSILVTNSTMLEYMLVRQQDHPIIEKSKGKLRWIILDEAHTYVGSHAAEISLLLRRVLHAFGVAANDVRFIATSATIGNADAEKGRVQLQQYLADIAGVETSRVTVVQGFRSIPKLPSELSQKNVHLPKVIEMGKMDQAELFSSLASNQMVRTIRSELAKGPKTLNELTLLKTGTKQIKDLSPADRSKTLELLDFCRASRLKDEMLLPLRIHLFHRTQKGMWACCSANCPGRKNSSLDNPEWAFGKIFMEHREACDEKDCSSKVFELVFCDTCGAEYLAAEEHIDDDGSILFTRNFESDDSDIDDEALIDDTENEADSKKHLISMVIPRLLLAPGKVEVPSTIDRVTGRLFPSDGLTRSVGMLPDDPDDNSFRCVRCKDRERDGGTLFRPARTSAAFHLMMSIPTLLEYSPPIQDHAQLHPYGGRRLITFSDSRQATARFSLQAQLDAERNYVRSWLFHQVSANRPIVDSSVIDAIKSKIASLELAVKALNDSNIKGMLQAEQSRLKELEDGPIALLPWARAVEYLAGTEEIAEWLPRQWAHTSIHNFKPTEIARLCLLREFARRPKRQTSLETLGLVALRYPEIESLPESSLPAAWKQRRHGIEDWRDFLKICLDMFVRANAAVQVPDGFNRWIGTKIRSRFIVDPETDPAPKWSICWPLAYNSNPRSRLAILLFRALNLSPDDSDDRATVNELLRRAWSQVRLILSPHQGGYRLDLDQKAVLCTLGEGWLCPITRRVLDVTLMGISPYVSLKMDIAHAKCSKIKLPELKFVFGRDTEGKDVSREAIFQWMNTDPIISELRQMGVWSSYSDRITSYSNFFRIAEHSAQQNSKRLRGLEKSFKSADINILSCSTTMEMGVDIGGISTVAMNNAPPSPSNYLQRAGRAGRRGESEAVSFTLCQAIPHGESVYNNPAWPFRTFISLPQVSLQSERIIQRHINALALTHFLLKHAGDLTKLQSGGFFLSASADTQSHSEKMELWLEDNKERKEDVWLISGIERLTFRTSITGADPFFLLDRVSKSINKIRLKWCEEHDAIASELEIAGGEPEKGKASPAQVAIFKQLQRMEDEYLLGELASSGFLPGYGFPTAVVPFINTTMEDIRKSKSSQAKSSGSEREDNRASKRGYPSRELPLAIRDYAPGTDIVIDGLVYRSEGVTLHWHIPPGDLDATPEIQAFRQAWRCKKCGASGTRSLSPQACPVCGTESTQIKLRPYLQPSGFAVNIFDDPHNDLSFRTYIPVHQPWISAGSTPWSPLPRPELGQYRFSHEGNIFFQSGGTHGHGYAICLRCGRAASETGASGAVLPREMDEHKRLRGGKDPSGETYCLGNDQEWAIKRNQWLGVDITTDVFELQLATPQGGVIYDETATYSLAVALRQALAEKLGIADREIGCSSIPSLLPSGAPTRSIILYDTASGGAGYVAATAAMLPQLLKMAEDKLDCKRKCDVACHACLLTYDTQHDSKRLNRHKAISLFSSQLLQGLQLPDELNYFGPTSQLEFDSLPLALSRELQRADINELRVYLGGDSNQWDIHDWSLKSSLLKWASEGRKVVLNVPKSQLSSLDSAIANPLASLLEVSTIELRAIGNGDQKVQTLIAEIGCNGRSIRWASTSTDSLVPCGSWSHVKADDRCVKIVSPTPLTPTVGEMIPSDKIRKSPAGNFSELVIRTQMDGPIDSLGDRFWLQISKVMPQLHERFARKEPLKRIECRDRYFTSPSNVRLLFEVLKGLTAYYGQFGSNLSLTVETTGFLKSESRSTDMYHNDWQVKNDRNAVLKRLLAGLGGNVSIIEPPKHMSQHARDITLIWADGSKFTLRLDHGLSFLVSSKYIQFGFSLPVERQLKEVVTQQYDVKNKLGVVGTYLYLSDIS